MSLSRYARCYSNQDSFDLHLPFEKDFHAFFLYRDIEEDRSKIKRIKIELEKHGNVCGLKQDYFLPGIKITQNIEYCLKSSVTICFLLSKEFLKSPWCEKELSLAVAGQMKYKTLKKTSIIPIIDDLEEGEIPDSLMDITYQGYDDDNLISKLKRSINNAIACHQDDITVAAYMIRTLHPEEQIYVSSLIDKTNEELLLSAPLSSNYKFLKDIFGLDFKLEKKLLEHCSVFTVSIVLDLGKYIGSKNVKIHNLIKKTWENCIDSALNQSSDISVYDFLENETNIITFNIKVLNETVEAVMITSKPFEYRNSYIVKYRCVLVSNEKTLKRCSNSEIFVFEACGQSFLCSLGDSGILPIYL